MFVPGKPIQPSLFFKVRTSASSNLQITGKTARENTVYISDKEKTIYN